MFKSHTEITDTSVAPFECYLYIESDHGYTREAYEIDENADLDIDAMLSEVYPDHEVATYPQNGGSNYASIITDSRAPDDCVVWNSVDFYLENDNA